MSLRFRAMVAATCLILGANTGCQSGKLALPKLTVPSMTMPNLAFWKKDTLDADEIMPPAINYSPSDSSSDRAAMVADSRNANGSMPPVKPTGTKSSDSLDRFRSETANIYGQLAANSDSSAEGFNTANSKPPANSQGDFEPRKNNTGQFLANVKHQAPSNSQGFSGGESLSQRLSPMQSTSPSRTPYSGASASNGATGNSSSGFQPSNGPLPRTRYEQIADATMSSMPSEGLSPLGNPQNVGSISSPQSGSSQGAFTASESIPQHVINRHFDSGASPADSGQVAGVSYQQYPDTGYSAFQPRDTTAGGNAKIATVASLPDTLLLGQGTYAPGSVRVPDAMQPEQVSVPKRAAVNAVPGGSFQGR